MGKLELVNTLIRHTARVCTTLHFAGGTFSIEAPGDRGNVELSFFWDRFADRASLAQHPDIMALIAITGAVWIYAPQCAFGSSSQKWTMFQVSACLVPHYMPIVRASCTCTSHGEVAYGHDADGNSLARKAAAYPGPLNVALVDGPWEWHYEEVPDEEVAGGEMRWGMSLHPYTRKAVNKARFSAPCFASHRRLCAIPHSRWWSCPMPPEADIPPPPPHELASTDWSVATDSEGSDVETLSSALPDALRPARGRSV